MQKKNIGVFPGSFDPFTKGHENIVLRSYLLFDELFIGVGDNLYKTRSFSAELMKIKIEEVFKNYQNIKVKIYTGLTATFAQENDANFLIRGLRNTTDFEYENTISQANKYVYDDLETIFMITSPKYAYITSSIVKELYHFGKKVDKFLPYSLD